MSADELEALLASEVASAVDGRFVVVARDCDTQNLVGALGPYEAVEALMVATDWAKELTEDQDGPETFEVVVVVLFEDR